jgi:hypothetical protein
MQDAGNSNLCNLLIDKFRTKYRIEVKQVDHSLPGAPSSEINYLKSWGSHYKLIGTDVDAIFALKKEDMYARTFRPDMKRIFIEVFDKDTSQPPPGKKSWFFSKPELSLNIASATIYISTDIFGKNEAFYIGLIQSNKKGMGKELLYLLTCKANQMNYKVKFEAMPEAIRERKSSLFASKNAKKQKGRKLFNYYNSLGFKRNGEEDYNSNIGVTQKYLTNSKEIIPRISEIVNAGAALGGTRRQKKNKRNTRKNTRRFVY